MCKCMQLENLEGEDIPLLPEEPEALDTMSDEEIKDYVILERSTWESLKGRKAKSYRLVFMLWLFFGWSGAHHFYLGRPAHGAIMAMSGGLFGLGWFADAFMLQYYTRDANAGVSKHAGVHVTCGTWANQLATLFFIFAALLYVVFYKGPELLRRSAIIECDWSASPFEVLGVPTGTRFSDCRKAYRDLAKKWHPDHNPGCGARCTEEMAKINRAFEQLKENDGNGVFGGDIYSQWEEVFQCISDEKPKQEKSKAKPFHQRKTRATRTSTEGKTKKKPKKPKKRSSKKQKDASRSEGKKSSKKTKSSKRESSHTGRRPTQADARSSKRRNTKKSSRTNRPKSDFSPAMEQAWRVASFNERSAVLFEAYYNTVYLAVRGVLQKEAANDGNEPTESEINSYVWSHLLTKVGVAGSDARSISPLLVLGVPSLTSDDGNDYWRKRESVTATMQTFEDAGVVDVEVRMRLAEAIHMINHHADTLARAQLGYEKSVYYMKKMVPALLPYELADVVPLSDAALDEAGITKLEHRRLILEAAELAEHQASGEAKDGVDLDEMQRLAEELNSISGNQRQPRKEAPGMSDL